MKDLLADTALRAVFREISPVARLGAILARDDGRIATLLMDYVTKDDLRVAIAPLPTRKDMNAAIAAAVAPLPTREDINVAIAAAVGPLPTREDMNAAIAAAVAPLPTREETNAAIAAALTRYPTRKEMREEIRRETRAALVPYPTREELNTALARYATREEMREEGETTRRHMEVLFESLRDDIRLLAEGQVALHHRIEDVRTELKADIAALDRRVMRLEARR